MPTSTSVLPTSPGSRAARDPGRRAGKGKVAGRGEGERDALGRVAAVRDALGHDGRIRVDANGGWDTEQAASMLRQLSRYGLEYAEQPCATLDELARLRRLVDVPLAADESIRKASDPLAVRAAGAPRIRGLRGAPLAIGFHRRAEAGDLRLSVRIDERSAAFCALGLAKASGSPAAVLCTSGTAAAHFHAAVIEADESAVPLLVLTADRPPELRGTGANQTIDQLRLYGPAVRWFCEMGVPEAGAAQRAYWRSAARRAWGVASGAAPGGPGPPHPHPPLPPPLL